MLAFFVFGNRCPVVREVASWAVVLLVSLVVQDSVFRGLTAAFKSPTWVQSFLTLP